MPYMRKGKSRKTHKNKSHRRAGAGFQKGGSPASSIVMADCTMNPPVMNDYAGADRIRENWYDPSLSALEPKCCGQMGGSLASQLVNEQLTGKAKTEPFDPALSPKGDMNSLNLYQTTGGARRRRRASRKNKKTSRSRSSSSRNNNRRSKSKRRNTRNNRTQRSQRGGASDWISTLYSQGPINNPEHSTGAFSLSGATSQAELMVPKTLGLAGSGAPMGSLEGANVSHVGAPIS
jgi:hypothetical protein